MPAAWTRRERRRCSEKRASHFSFRSREIFLEASLSRNFELTSPQGGGPLKATIELLGEGNESFPTEVVADRVWVFNGNETWSAPLSEPPEGQWLPNGSHWVKSGGPKWDPGILVNVTVQLDLAGQDSFFLGVRNVRIDKLA